MLEEKGICLAYEDDVPAYIAKESFSASFGARNMRRYLQKEVEDRLAEEILSDTARAVTQARLSVGDEGIRVDCM